MKVAIISINDRIALHGKTARSIDSIWLKKYIEHTRDNIEVKYVTHKILELKDNNSVLSYEDTDLSEFDELYVINSLIHFIGGDVKKHTIKIIKDICNFKKKINILYIDPKIYFINFPKKVFSGSSLKYKDSLRVTEEDIKKWEDLNTNILFGGRDYYKCVKNFKNRKYFQDGKTNENIPFLEFMFMNKDFNFEKKEKKYDICYWGDKRQSDRQRKLEEYFSKDEDLKKLIIGQEKDYIKCDCYKKLEWSKTIQLVKTSISTLVMGDNEHDNNIVTPRFFEAIKTECIAFIDKRYDSDMRLIKNEKLRNLLYVDSVDKIKDSLHKIKKFNAYDKIIAAQYRELEKWDNLKLKK